MTSAPTVLKPRGTTPLGMGATGRRDRWWLAPTVQGVLFTACALYLFWSGILWTPIFGTGYDVDGYLSPLFSPLIVLPFLPSWVSPGLLILWIPLGFRATCYYWRRAYYRFYFADPPACATGEPLVHRRYAMETSFPFILQNLHRYFVYLSFIPLAFLWLDTINAFLPASGPRIGLGAVLFLVDNVLLTGYVLGCHSIRHFVGGRVDCFSCSRRRQVRRSIWQRVTRLNEHHMFWAWSSLITVSLADLYVRLLALGIVVDPAIHL